MIRKWRTRFIIYMLITVFLAVIGYYLAASVTKTNDSMEDLKNNGSVAYAELIKLQSVSYTDEGSYRWGYKIPDDILPPSYERKGVCDGATSTSYTQKEAEELKTVKVYFKFDENGEIYTFDANYVENFVPWQPVQSVFLWVLASLSLAMALTYLIRNIIVMRVASKGEPSIGNFVEATHPKWFSSRYYKIKYTFIKDGETVTAVSPAIYDGKEVDKLYGYGSFQVRYKGKISVISEKL